MFTDTQTSSANASQTSFVWKPVTCELCFGIGLRHRPTGGIEECPALQLGSEHCDLSEEGKRICRAVEVMRRRKLDVDPIHFDVARSLAQFSTDKPCSSHELGQRHFSYKDGEDRRRLVTKNIKFLRDIWFLPVASRKEKPMGYWISVTEQDFRKYVERATNEPISTLSTLHRMAKANWPEFAEQMEIDVWKDFGVEEKALSHDA